MIIYFFIEAETREISFKRGANTRMCYACTFNLYDQHYIIGGLSFYNDGNKQVKFNKILITIFLFFKISILNGCSIQRLSDMPRETQSPACASFTINDKSFALICFADDYEQTCYKLVIIFKMN